MTFDQWWIEQAEHGNWARGDYGIAKAAWNKAIEVAADKVAERYDELEPWIEPSDIYNLSA